ncbi:MAG: hypothetical protein M3R36_06565 [Bacteroidota bacterium]|nr:hypothetical protein [Bacteroidota bacterium]
MIKNPEFLRRFEDEQTANDEMSLEQKLSLLNSIYKFAIKLGTLPPKDLLEGLEVDIKVTKIANGI